MTKLIAPNAGGIEAAVDLLKQGECVALPTETVYGLAANATNADAVARIYEAKGRPDHNPLIVHVATIEDVTQLIEMNAKAQALAARFWPGPLTIVGRMKAGKNIAPAVTAGLETLAVRVPNHPVFRAVLQGCGFPLAAPSANASGTISATSPQIVMAGLSGKIPLVVAGGTTDKGVESTIIDLSGDEPALLRHGGVPKELIEAIIGALVDATKPTATPKSPGQLLRHYAPRARLRLNAVDVAPGEALLAFGSLKFMGIQGGGWAKDLPFNKLKNLSETGDIDEAAHNLFLHLHDLDQSGATTVAVMPIPETGIGVAVNDRLRRACQAQETV